MHIKTVKPITSPKQVCFGLNLRLNKFLGGIIFILLIIASSGASWAADLSTAKMKNLVIDHSKNTRLVDPALGLAVARVMSNFDPEAVGPAQRIGLFQLDPYRLSGAHSKRDLLEPVLNTKIGLSHLDRLISENNGDVAMALIEFNDGNQLGPWPSSRVVSYPGGFVANVFAARAVFEKNLSIKNKLSTTLIKAWPYELVTENFIYPTQELKPDLPRWRKKIAETIYWLHEINETKRTIALKDKI